MRHAVWDFLGSSGDAPRHDRALKAKHGQLPCSTPTAGVGVARWWRPEQRYAPASRRGVHCRQSPCAISRALLPSGAGQSPRAPDAARQKLRHLRVPRPRSRVTPSGLVSAARCSQSQNSHTSPPARSGLPRRCCWRPQGNNAIAAAPVYHCCVLLLHATRTRRTRRASCMRPT